MAKEQEKSKCCEKCKPFHMEENECVYQGKCPCHTPQPSTPNYIESVLKEFDEKFFMSVTNELGWRLPRIAYFWENSGKTVEWEDMEIELKSFLSTALEKQQKADIADFIEKIEGMKQKTCTCEDDIGYHTKECNFMPFGYNQALQDIVSLLKE